ncbi:hypothetical protein [Streptomyces nigrescens]|uniref:DUF2087 domain-containing protein n=1 Tax=Streptomyces nigrescens TaxID=1920 RepID=A0A640TAV6_STRNI|nr:hypothetical protein [Streptomyces libani]WAT94984.1 hypothetical protein STRLI_000657 [Streptomyces libani subsp. libani]GFE20142.1 hypothetical protein Sliba_05950 [Streptomyces libani subsp. libani]GGV85974.1 hypothetical protein GCM10010500_03390 [Streptomyces libani subsp. libani]
MNAGTHRSVRINHLLTEMRDAPVTTWTTGQVQRLYDTLGFGPQRSTARGDLKHLAARGRLIESGPADDRGYRLSQAGGR